MKNFLTGGERVRQARAKIESLERRKLAQGTLKSRHQTELDQARGITRRHMLTLIGLGVAGVGMPGLVVSIASKPERPSSPPQLPPIPASTENPEVDFEQIIEFQERQKQRMLRALAKFKDVNTDTKKLYEMLEKHAFYSVPMGPRATQRIFPVGTTQEEALAVLTDQDPHAFEIVFMPEELAQYLDSPVVWQGDENVLRFAAHISSDDWLAILGYHELSHVWDQHFGGEDPRDPEQWTDGEVRAHELECKIIQIWNPSAYEKLITGGIPLWEHKNFRAIMELSERLYPIASLTEMAKGQAYAALITCVAFEHAKKAGKSLNAVYRNELLPTNKSVH